MPQIGYVVLAHYLSEYFEGNPMASATKNELISWGQTQPFWNDTNLEEFELAFTRLTDLTCATYTEPKLVFNENGKYICPYYIEKYNQDVEKRANAYASTIVEFVNSEVKKGRRITHIIRDDYSLYHCESDKVLIEKLKGLLPSHYKVDVCHNTEIPINLYISWK